MRAQEQIAERAVKADGFLNFSREVLIPLLDFDHAKPFLKPEATAEKWKPVTQEESLAEMREYMDFAWGKAQDHRGISAGRSVQKMTEWTWIHGTDEQVAEIERMSDEQYAQYGAPVLKRVCEMFGFPIPKDPDLVRMMGGLPCEDGCEMGCGQ